MLLADLKSSTDCWCSGESHTAAQGIYERWCMTSTSRRERERERKRKRERETLNP